MLFVGGGGLLLGLALIFLGIYSTRRFMELSGRWWDDGIRRVARELRNEPEDPENPWDFRY